MNLLKDANLYCIPRNEAAHVERGWLHLGEDDQHQHQEVEESTVPPKEMAGLLVVLLEVPVFVAGAFLDPFPLPEGEC